MKFLWLFHLLLNGISSLAIQIHFQDNIYPKGFNNQHNSLVSGYAKNRVLELLFPYLEIRGLGVECPNLEIGKDMCRTWKTICPVQVVRVQTVLISFLIIVISTKASDQTCFIFVFRVPLSVAILKTQTDIYLPLRKFMRATRMKCFLK
jgi:hypothetical protein